MALQNDSRAQATTFINIRKLAALDMYLHGQRVILAEFAFGVFFSAGLGLFLLYTGIFREHPSSVITVTFGGWLVFLTLNYLSLLLYATSIARRKSTQTEIATELADKDNFVRKYTLQSLLLLLPLVVPILALMQETRRHRQ
jgi:hypothetical protein